MEQYLLAEAAAGYALFKVAEFDEIGRADEEIQEAMTEASLFSKMVKLVAFRKFEAAEEALEEVNSIANGEASDVLKQFLEINLPKKKKSYELGVIDPALGNNLKEQFNCNHNDTVKELLRGVRAHFSKLVKDLSAVDANNARLGLGHCYSRSKMQLDPNRQDKPIMNTIALLDNLDKNINAFAMRVREWYAWHFPEMTKIATDNVVYAKVAKVIRVRDNFNDEDEEQMAKLNEATENEEVSKEIIAAMKMSMGQDIMEMDMINIDNFAEEVIKLSEMRKSLIAYLRSKMNAVAPNLAVLIGDAVGARLISHAGSLTNLAKYPASTVQILGAEKALFRALKTKSNTPKYGLIYHSPFIGRATAKNKGRISRYLANKASVAARIDCFADDPTTQTTLYGEKLKEQVEERLTFLVEGKKPRKNLEVMQEAMEEHAVEVKKNKKAKKKAAKAAAAAAAEEGEEPVSSPKKKRKHEEITEEVAEEAEPMKKKKKKNKTVEETDTKENAEEPNVEEEAPVEGEKKKKKKKKNREVAEEE